VPAEGGDLLLITGEPVEHLGAHDVNIAACSAWNPGRCGLALDSAASWNVTSTVQHCRSACSWQMRN
jgi:hypothetical protein